MSIIGNNVLFLQKRSIAGYIPNVVVEERHLDRLTITQHPVEQGAAITDHAFVNPARLLMRCLWSNAGTGVIGSLFGIGLNSIQDVYDNLLKLQADRNVFDVVTGKRSYNNMLLESLMVTTDRNSENILEVTAQFQQIIIVQTSALTLQGLNSTSVADPKTASGISSVGNKNLSLPQNPASVVNGLQNNGFIGQVP